MSAIRSRLTDLDSDVNWELVGLAVVLVGYSALVLTAQNYPMQGTDHPMHVWAATRLEGARQLFDPGVANPIAQLLQASHGYVVQLFPYLVYKALSLLGVTFSERLFDLPVYLLGVAYLTTLFLFLRRRSVSPHVALGTVAVIGVTPGFLAVTRDLQGYPIFSMFLLVTVLYQLERDRGKDNNSLLTYVLTALYVGAGNHFFVGYFLWFPAYQSVMAFEDGANFGDAVRAGLRKWFLSPGNLLPVGAIGAYVTFSVAWVALFGLSDQGYLLRVFFRPGGSDPWSTPGGLFSIFVTVTGLGFVALTAASYLLLFRDPAVRSDLSELFSRRPTFDAVSPRTYRLGLYTAMFAFLTFGLSWGASNLYAVMGATPAALIVGHGLSRLDRGVAVALFFLTLLVTGGVAAHSVYALGSLDVGSTGAGVPAADDGSRATGYFMRSWDAAGKLTSGSRSIQSSGGATTFVDGSVMIVSTKPGDLIYSGVEAIGLGVDSAAGLNASAAELVATAENDTDIRRGSSAGVVEVESTEVPTNASKEGVILIYRADLGADFNEAMFSLAERDALTRNLVVREDGEAIAAVYSTHIEETHEVTLSRMNERYWAQYGDLDDYTDLKLGLY